MNMEELFTRRKQNERPKYSHSERLAMKPEFGEEHKYQSSKETNSNVKQYSKMEKRKNPK